MLVFLSKCIKKNLVNIVYFYAVCGANHFIGYTNWAIAEFAIRISAGSAYTFYFMAGNTMIALLSHRALSQTNRFSLLNQ